MPVQRNVAMLNRRLVCACALIALSLLSAEGAAAQCRIQVDFPSLRDAVANAVIDAAVVNLGRLEDPIQPVAMPNKSWRPMLTAP